MRFHTPRGWIKKPPPALKSLQTGSGNSLLRLAIVSYQMSNKSVFNIPIDNLNISLESCRSCSYSFEIRLPVNNYFYQSRLDLAFRFLSCLHLLHSVCGCSCTPSTENTVTCLSAPAKARYSLISAYENMSEKENDSVFHTFVLMYVSDLRDVCHNTTRLSLSLCF